MSDYLKLAIRHAAEYVSARSVAIVVRDKDGNAATGSSTCISIAGRLLLATAGHVIEDLEDSRITLIPSGRWSGRSPLRWFDRSCSPGRRAPGTDVAWIELDSASAHACNLRFLTLSDLLPGQEYDRERSFMVQGHPHEAAIIGEEFADVESNAAMTLMPSLHELPRDLRAHELAFEWPPRDEAEQPMRGVLDPSGVSGGGVWYLPRHDEQLILSPAYFRLVGINVSWHRASSVLFSVRIEHWLGLVARDLPDTREAITTSWSLD